MRRALTAGAVVLLCASVALSAPVEQADRKAAVDVSLLSTLESQVETLDLSNEWASFIDESDGFPGPLHSGDDTKAKLGEDCVSAQTGVRYGYTSVVAEVDPEQDFSVLVTVKAKGDVHIALSADPKFGTGKDKLYEVALGRTDEQDECIRAQLHGPCMASAKRPNRFSADKETQLTLMRTGRTLAVLDSDGSEVLRFEGYGDIPAKYVGVSTGYSSAGTWKVCVMSTSYSGNCVCPHGTPVSGVACRPYMYGREMCDSCEPDYHKTPHHTCDLTKCKCAHGEPVVGRECGLHGSEHCSSCEYGYFLRNETQSYTRIRCIRNQCTCANGTATHGSACIDGMEMCASCNSFGGYYLTDGVCKLKQCQCKYGVPVRAQSCAAHGDNTCQSCDDGFELDQELNCVRKVCACENGTPSTGLDCPESGSERCEHCGVGFTLDRKTLKCEAKRCTCKNGTPATGIKCKFAKGISECAGCDAGFHFSTQELGGCDSGVCRKGECIANECRCPMGTAMPAGNCSAHGHTQCSACNEGYHLDGGMCRVNECRCDNGVAAIEAHCPRHQGTQCVHCDLGYSVDPKWIAAQKLAKEAAAAEAKAEALTEQTAAREDEQQQLALAIQAASSPEERAELEARAAALNAELIGLKSQAEAAAVKAQRLIADSQAEEVLPRTCRENVCECSNGSPATGVACPTNGAGLEEDVTKAQNEYAAVQQQHEQALKREVSALEGAIARNESIGDPRVKTDALHRSYNATVESLRQDHELRLAELTDFCSSCNDGFALIAKHCFKNRCVCDNGVPTEGSTCATDGAVDCNSCADGYHLADMDGVPLFELSVVPENAICTVNECLCVSGTAATGADCPHHGSEVCTKCDNPLRTPYQGSCTTDMCNCEHGFGAKGAGCLQGHECESCFEGFDLDPVAKTCSVSECICENGQGTKGVGCSITGGFSCQECNDGYVLIEDQCILKQCSCHHGVGANGTSEHCPIHGLSGCSACHEGYYLKDSECRVNQCSCADGEAAVGDECPQHHTKACSWCSRGYHLDNHECVLNVCRCASGIEARGKDCPIHDTNQCANCDAGLHKEGDLCEPNVCYCPGGTPQTQAHCVQHGAVSCVTCEATHHMSPNAICVENECTCANGIAASSPVCDETSGAICCSVHGKELCTSCNVGYLLSDSQTCGAYGR